MVLSQTPPYDLASDESFQVVNNGGVDSCPMHGGFYVHDSTIQTAVLFINHANYVAIHRFYNGLGTFRSNHSSKEIQDVNLTNIQTFHIVNTSFYYMVGYLN